MSTITSQADFIRHGESLVEAVARCLPEEKRLLERDSLELQETLEEIKGLKARQEELTALRQEVTQRLTAAFLRGRESSLSLRALARGVLGPRNERLVHFKVAPARARKNKTVGAAKTRRGETSGTAPGAAVSPGTEPAV